MKFKSAVSSTLSLALCVAPALHAQTPPAPAAATQPAAAAPAAFAQGELESMLAPIALYPDALLSQMLMASTYPLEIVEAARWRKDNAALKGQALEDALTKQTWDESVKSLTAFPDVLDRMNKDLAWTQKLGDAFLGQQKQVLDTVQALRTKAKASGHLESNEQQTVKTETQENKEVIVIEPANPEVVYVPTYQPTVVYGGWGYPAYPPYYPPYWYPVATPFVSGFFWGVGIAAGAALWGGCNWGRGDVNINVNRFNNFNRTNISNGNWNHRVDHRGSVPYRDAGSRDKYNKGGDRQAAQARDQFRGRDDSLGGGGLNDRAGLKDAQNNPAVRDNAANRTGDRTGDRAGAGAAGDRAGDRAGAGGAGDRAGAGAAAGQRDVGGDRGASAGSNRASPSQSNRASAYSGGNGAQTRAASSRGHSSMGSGGASRGGGGARGGGGGGRGGGGRR